MELIINLRIAIEGMENKNLKSQKEVFTELETLRKKSIHIKVNPDLDLSSLANDVNGLVYNLKNKKGCHSDDSLLFK